MGIVIFDGVAYGMLLFLIGVLIDGQASPGASTSEVYSLDAFRVAFSVQYLVIGFGVVMLLIARRRTRRRIVEEEGIQVGPLWVAAMEAFRRRHP